MIIKILTLAFLFNPFIVALSSDNLAPGSHNGKLNLELQRVWHEDNQSWLTADAFWLDFTAQRGGLTWGTRTDYPEYSMVKEHDTMLIQIGSETCLMEFFHKRWRRANDVQRWDPQFSEFGACDKVFD